MKCPNCPDTALVMSDRQGVEIDYCPACRGIWLDRGELDKLLDRAAAAAAPAAAGPAPVPRSRHDTDTGNSHYRGESYYRDRKKSWLSDIFD